MCKIMTREASKIAKHLLICDDAKHESQTPAAFPVMVRLRLAEGKDALRR